MIYDMVSVVLMRPYDQGFKRLLNLSESLQLVTRDVEMTSSVVRNLET